MDALDEAQKLMSELTADDTDPLTSTDTPAGGGDDGGFTFSIDSDEEEEVKVNVAKKETVESHPLDHPLLETDPPADQPTTTPAPAAVTPSTTQAMPPSAPVSAPAAGILGGVSNAMMTGMAAMQPQQQQVVPPQQPMQHAQPTAAPHPSAYAMGTAPPTGTPTGSSAGSAAFLSGDAWKQQTSRFASSLANMAQRAAHQVATVAQQPPTSGGSAASYGSNSAVITTQPGMNGVAGVLPGGQPVHSSSTTAMMMGQPQQQQQPPGSAAAMAMQNAAALDNEQKAALIKSHVGELLPGERIIMFVANLMHVSDSTGFSYTYAQQQPGNESDTIWCCAMTYYRLILFGTGKFTPPPRPADWNPACWPSRPVHVLQMPLASMERVEKSVFSASLGSPGAVSATSNTISTTSLMGLQIVGKDNGRSLRFTTPSYADTARAHEALQTYAFPGRRNLGYLFAFESKKDDVMKSIETDSAGNKRVTLEPCRKRFEPLVEFTRQFQKCTTGESQTCPWTIYQSINDSYQLCSSYPSVLAGPSTLEDTNPDAQRVLQQSASFRSEQRLPMLTFAAGNGGGSIWRCSQPKIGLQGNRNSADEWLLKQILEQAVKANAMNHHTQQVIPQQILMQLTGSPTLEHLQSNWLPQTASGTCELKILDLRPRSSAMANRTGGYGYENTSNYPGTTLQFCGIGNIHAVRDAYQKMSNVCMGVSTQDSQWNSLVEDSKWPSMTRLILASAWETAYWVHVFHAPILLHCSHGWDRTSQVACVAELLLDPFYRTMEGFACLVEKDFMAFGHPFHTRCAHGVGGSGNSSSGNNMVGGTSANGDVDEGQISPVFMQFLDCVYQLIELYPEAFEITTRYLLDLSDHVYSCRFGNFLCDTERERETVAGIRQRTHSVWDFLEARHGGDTVKAQAVAQGGVLLMPLPTLMRNISLWSDRHAKYGPKPTQRWLPTPLPTVKIHPDAGRHDDDTPEFHRVPTLQESQTQILAPAVSSIAPLSSDFSISDADDA